MKIKVKTPMNNQKNIFDELDYDEYIPYIHVEDKQTIITRIGLFFNYKGVIPNSIYKNPVIQFKSSFIALFSLIKRKIFKLPMSNIPTLVIHSPWTAGYYHWITECIPKILYCKNQNLEFNILIPPHKNYDNYKESLYLLGFNTSDFVYFKDGKNMIGKNFIIPNCPKQFGTIGPDLSKLIRNTYHNIIKVNENVLNENKRIYITRELARGRKVINEKEVIEILKNYNFEIIAFENLSFKEQIKLMKQSEALISIHGAALTNMLFLNPNSKVLEFVPKKKGIREYNYIRNSIKHDACYVRLASNLGHEYYVQECDTPNCSKRTTHMCDIKIDLTKLKNNLELMFPFLKGKND